MKLTQFQAGELRYRLDIVADEQDLLDDYGVTQEQIEALSRSVPERGEWDCPAWAADMVREELGTTVAIMRDEADSMTRGIALDPEFDKRRRKEAAAIKRQARALEKLLPE